MEKENPKITLTHGDKLLFPASGIPKSGIVGYYERIADYMLPYLKDRPLTMRRFTDGIDQEGFYQKNASDHFPNWIQTARVKKEDGWLNQVLCNNKETLAYLANQDVIEFHVTLGKVHRLDYPDKLVFDLDPPNGNFSLVIKAAKALHDLLEQKMGLHTFVMTTGSRGLHIAAPLDGTQNFDETREFAKRVADYLCRRNPKEFTTAIRKKDRKNRLFVDYLRNAYAQTAIAPFSVRALKGAPVATPLYWSELDNKKLNAQSFDINSIFQRLKKKGDPWSDFNAHAKSQKKSSEKLDDLLQEHVSVS
ncbi:non-homologous end-joining DNA ligase [Flagellimonas lutaonensis]|nr:non-homologous end-joining DNA ligase [Allomuricauda lutaonensis]